MINYLIALNSEMEYAKTKCESLESILNINTNLIQAAEKKIMTSQYEIETLKSDIQHKVDKSDLNDLREVIERRYATKTDIEGTKGMFSMYARLTSVRIIEQDLSVLNNELEQSYMKTENTLEKI